MNGLEVTDGTASYLTGILTPPTSPPALGIIPGAPGKDVPGQERRPTHVASAMWRSAQGRVFLPPIATPNTARIAPPRKPPRLCSSSGTDTAADVLPPLRTAAYMKMPPATRAIRFS